jgi:hypothetical protein
MINLNNMKKNITYCSFLLLYFVTFFASCSSDEQPGNINYTLSQLSTLQPQVNGLNITLGGNVTVAGDFLNTVGVCWSQQPNPTINDGVASESYSEPGEFTLTVTNLQPNTTYYARAFASAYMGSIPVQYGNQVTFTTGTNVSTFNVTNIVSRKATLNGYVSAIVEGPAETGFVYSTSPNPTINNSQYISGFINGSDNYSLNIQNLTPDTVYYVRAYQNGAYGEQVQFRTTGYTGPGGGYVAYDKGEFIDGWRYLEVHPTTLNYNNIAIGSQWGTLNSFVSGTSPQIGAGPSNTSIIVNAATEANCAAKLCDNLTLNGYSDWFLGSKEEMVLIANSVNDAGHYLEPMWTSTQHNADYAVVAGYNFTSNIFNSYNDFKSISFRVYPVRRY